ncbi:MAG: PASTA domain-containing protein [Deltaproteobacteria bacterium]|jgi:beta-lactam-binding protein with PASTA domain
MALLNKLLKFGIYAVMFLAALVCSLYFTSKWIVQSEEEVLVPNLVGHDTVYALDQLTSLGLNIKVGGFMWSESVPKNFIASQKPDSGTWLKKDRDVKVIISRGSKRVRVPKLVGTKLREAKLVLGQNGLQLGGICRVPDSQYPPGTIIAQRPEFLQEIERGQSVDFLISTGSKSIAVAMPELRQRSVGQALKMLEGLSLLPSEVKEIHRPDQPLNTVVDQRPLSGYRVDGDTSIVLTINRLPHPKGQAAKLWWFTYHLAAGYFKKEITLSQHQDGEDIDLYRRIHRPGEQLDWLIWARSPDEVSILVDGLPQRQEASSFSWLRYFSLGEELAPLPFVKARRAS